MKEHSDGSTQDEPLKVLPDGMTGSCTRTRRCTAAGRTRSCSSWSTIRASQINGRSACVAMGVESAKKQGETDERLHNLVSWRETPYFTGKERAALELTEAATRLADRPNPVTDEIWNAAADHFDERQLSAIVLMIAFTNCANRINATIRHSLEGEIS